MTPQRPWRRRSTRTSACSDTRLETSREGLHISIVGGLSRSAVVDAYLVLIGPQVHKLAGELRAVIAAKRLGTTAAVAQPLECGDDIVRAKLLPHLDG